MFKVPDTVATFFKIWDQNVGNQLLRPLQYMEASGFLVLTYASQLCVQLALARTFPASSWKRGTPEITSRWMACRGCSYLCAPVVFIIDDRRFKQG